MRRIVFFLGFVLMAGEGFSGWSGSEVSVEGRCYPFLSPLITTTGARVRLVKAGLGENWIFFPGGPGLGAEYLEPLARALGVRGSVWLVDYPGTFDGVTERVNLGAWKESVDEIIRSFDSPVPVGHSFGAMLLMSTPLSSKLTGVVFMDTSPDDAWLHLAGQSGLQTPEMDALEAEFSRNPSDDMLKKLFLAWSPYYFSADGLKAGCEAMSNINYCAPAYMLGRDQFFKAYTRAAWLPDDTPTLLIGGAEDKLTPLRLFDRCRFLSAPRTRVASIPGAGQSPWVENPERVLREFQDFDRFLHQ